MTALVWWIISLVCAVLVALHLEWPMGVLLAFALLSARHAGYLDGSRA